MVCQRVRVHPTTKFADQHAEKQAFAETASIEREGCQKYNPHEIGGGGPPIVWPFVLVVSDVAEGRSR